MGRWFQNNRHQSVECFKRMTEFMTFLITILQIGMCFITPVEGSVSMGFSTDTKVCRCAPQAVMGRWFQNNRHQSVECFKRMTEFLGGLCGIC